jgi:hypothetical protein
MKKIEKRTQLQNEISLIKEQREALRVIQRANPNTQTETELRALRPKLKFAERDLEQFESRLLLKEALDRGIAVSRDSDWWSNDRKDYERPGQDGQFIDDMTTVWLSETGRAMVTRLIRDDRKKNVEWWIKVITPLLGAAISILGLLIALITVSRR